MFLFQDAPEQSSYLRGEVSHRSLSIVGTGHWFVLDGAQLRDSMAGEEEGDSGNFMIVTCSVLHGRVSKWNVGIYLLLVLFLLFGLPPECRGGGSVGSPNLAERTPFHCRFPRAKFVTCARVKGPVPFVRGEQGWSSTW